jgi:hypothetical protein
MIGTMFTPNLTLAREPDGEYTLHAVTITPNSCYSAGRAERGVPPMVRIVAEVEPVLLHVRQRGGMCLQVLKPVRHHLRDLKLGASHGKTTLTAFVMLGDSLLGSASLDVSHLGGVVPGQGKDNPIDTSDWYAWLDRMPPGPARFHVTGVVTMPTPGYDVKLVRGAPQGINPKDLLLDLVIAKKEGIWPQVVTAIPVRYDEDPAAVDYESVLVRLPDGSGIPIKVETVF